MITTIKYLLLTCLLMTLPAGAQVAFVTTTGTNANYANGTLTANFKTPPNTSQSSYSGQRFPFTMTATLNSSGAWSMVLADNSTLYPAASQWQLNLCSQGTYLVSPTCYLVTMPVSCIGNSSCFGSSLDLTTAFAAAPVPPGTGGGTVVLNPNSMAASDGAGHLATMPEKGTSTSGGPTAIAWQDDLNAGVYDPRDIRWAGGVFGATPAAAAQAMSNQMACDLAMGKVQHAIAEWPQGQFYCDNFQIAPGSDWEGTPQSDGGTIWHSQYNNHPCAVAPTTMTLTCSDGQSHTDSLGFTRVDHFTLEGCGAGGCTNAPGETPNYQNGGPGNTGLQMFSNGMVEHVFAQNFGGFGIKMSGQDDKIFHSRLASNDEWYIFGSYKGVNESATSPEASTTTTGATSSVALSWAAVTNATGYVIYRGSTAGGESAFFLSTTNSFTDTGAAGTAGIVTNVVTQTTTAAPGTITPTPSTTGGTLSAGTYFYKVTATTADGWHGSIELGGLDGMGGWIEAYGFQDIPTVYNYHHLADILGSGGDSHYDHLWPQLGQVGIAQPQGAGAGDVYTNVRIDGTRLEGFFTTDVDVTVAGGIIDNSCTGSNAQTINTGQEGARFAGQCNAYWTTGTNSNLSNVWFSYNSGVFGPTFATADIMSEPAQSSIRNVRQATYQSIAGEGVATGGYWDPQTAVQTNVTGPTPSMTGLKTVYPSETSPITYTGFTKLQVGQDFYVRGTNANVTLQYNSTTLVTCSGQNVNLGNVPAYLHFVAYSSTGVIEVCDSNSSLVNAETVAFSTTPTFSVNTKVSSITLTGSVTSFTLAAGVDGQAKTLIFCQNGTGGFTVAPPANVHGFFTVGATASKCSSQQFTYSAAQAAWLAASGGATNI